MLTALILDMDGVVVDSHPAHMRAWRLFLASVGKEVSNEELEFVLEGRKREDILQHFLGELTDEQVRQYGARKEALFKNGASEIRPVNGLHDFLGHVTSAGLAMALASSGSRARVEYTLRQLDFRDWFQAVVTGDDVARGKPDPALFLLAADRMQVRPDEVLVCEDAVNGVEAAKAAGMRCLAIAANGRGPLLEKAGADRVIPDFIGTNLDDLRGLFA